MVAEQHYLPNGYIGRVTIYFGLENDTSMARIYVINKNGKCTTALKPNYWNTDNIERDARFYMINGTDTVQIPYLRENVKSSDKYFIDRIIFCKDGEQFFMLYDVSLVNDKSTY
jgi:hypothetical protein